MKGDTVFYASFDSIADTLEYDFERERAFDYGQISQTDVVGHLARFIAGIWQIHPFGEGNTRTTAVFLIKYLGTLGYQVSNDPFKAHSWYFRNALVRANYSSNALGVHATTQYLERFLENLLLGSRHELKNRHMHLDWNAESGLAAEGATQETTQESGNTTQETKGATQETTQETAFRMQDRILELLEDEPKVTARQISERLGVGFDGVRYHLTKLRKAGVIHHEGPTKGGRWVVDKRS